MSFCQFEDMLKVIEEPPLFSKWKTGPSDCFGCPCTPVSLLLLGSLRCLGRGFTFDDIEEATAISEETHRLFFHAFIEFGSTKLYNKYVITPTTSEEAKTHTTEMTMAGFPGCIGSTDATHVAMETCAYRLRQMHLGFKLPYPCRAYNLTANHRRYIMHTTSGHPSRWNDKTLQQFDTLMVQLQSGELLGDLTFELYDRNDEGEVIKVKYNGGWLIVDNGYTKCPTCIPPLKHTFSRKAERWSQWMESMRKDVECTFGILKKRWRILKHPVRIRGVEKTDKIWKTCCSLHNMLLQYDGLDTEWLDSSKENFAVERLNSEHLVEMSDVQTDESVSGMGLTEVSFTEINKVRDLSHSLFQLKLIEHFDIAFQKNEIIWPSR